MEDNTRNRHSGDIALHNAVSAAMVLFNRVMNLVNTKLLCTTIDPVALLDEGIRRRFLELVSMQDLYNLRQAGHIDEARLTEIFQTLSDETIDYQPEGSDLDFCATISLMKDRVSRLSWTRTEEIHTKNIQKGDIFVITFKRSEEGNMAMLKLAVMVDYISGETMGGFVYFNGGNHGHSDLLLASAMQLPIRMNGVKPGRRPVLIFNERLTGFIIDHFGGILSEKYIQKIELGTEIDKK